MLITFLGVVVRLFSDRQPNILRYLAVTVLLAASTFTRPITYCFILPLVIILFFYSYRQINSTVSLKCSLIGPLLVIIIYGLLIGSWIMRNYYRTGAAVFTSLPSEHLYWNYGGKILSIINHSSLDDESTRLSLLSYQQEKISLKAMVDYCNQQASGIFLDHPVLLMKVFFSGMFSTLWSPGTVFLREHLGYHNNIIREGIKWFGICYLFFGYVAAIGGVLQLTLKKAWSFSSFLLLVLLLFLIIFSSTPVGYYRFRVPFWPFICLFAGHGISLLKLKSSKSFIRG
jgi:hypothetical protein